MNYKMRSIFFLFIIVFFNSCKKDNRNTITQKVGGNVVVVTNNDLRTTDNVYLHIFDNVNGGEISISEKQSATGVVYGYPAGYEVSASIRAANNMSNGSFTSYLVGQQNFSPDPSVFSAHGNILYKSSSSSDFQIYKALFNAKQTVSLSDINNVQQYQASVYFPASLSIMSEPAQVNKYAPIADANTGIQLTWNADPNNPNGMAIVLEDIETYETPSTTYVFTVADNGNFKIASEYLSNFLSYLPSSQQYAHIKISVYRGDHQILTGVDGRTYKVLVYSMFSVVYQLH